MIRLFHWKPTYRQAMMSAIERARVSALTGRTTKTNGLRVIRTFERINGIPFDPFNRTHLSMVAGMGIYECLFRRFRLMGIAA